MAGRVPGSRGLRLAGVMYCNVTLGAVTVAIYKPQTPARAQSPANAFPNLAGSNLPDALGAAQTYILWFVWLPYDVLWGKRRRFWCKASSPRRGVAAGERGRGWQSREAAEPAPCPCPLLHASASPQANSSPSYGLRGRGGRFLHLPSAWWFVCSGVRSGMASLSAPKRGGRHA